MKKHLSLIVAICISLSSFSAPWDIKSKPVKYSSWDEPLRVKRFDTYCDYYIGYVTGTWPMQTFTLNATLNQSPGVKWLVQIQVLGIWYGHPGYPNSADYKVFDIIYNPSQWNKTINDPLMSSEEAYPGVMDIIYDGPY